MMRTIPIQGLEVPEAWRGTVRALLAEDVPPEWLVWSDGQAPTLFESSPTLAPPSDALVLPKSFVRLAETVLMHRQSEKFGLLYRIAWRLRYGRLRMADLSDADVVRAAHIAKAVGRDIHKMRAFVRFREVREGDTARFVAWFEPDHLIVRANAGFFVRRFAAMRWSILTPDLCIHWDGERVTESAGLAERPDLNDDGIEQLWTRYYASIFNPARLKVAAMVKELPRRYWKNLPEAELIPGLIAAAKGREAEMLVTADQAAKR